MRLGWVIVYVDDVEAAVDFYERAFGLEREVVVPDGQFGQLATGETKLAFARTDLGDANFAGGVQPPGERPANVEVALVDEDVDAAWRRALDAGCTPLAPPADKPQGQRVAYVRDPFGTLVELCTPL
jgi:uncharacterized glyoxalase superfamily protein PhnB